MERWQELSSSTDADDSEGFDTQRLIPQVDAAS
jgi:hypothetical protein